MKKILPKIVAGLVLLIVVVAIGFIPVKTSSVSEKQEPTPTAIPPKTYSKGFSITPKSFEEEAFLDFFERVKNTSDFVLWAGDATILKNQNSDPYVLLVLSKNYSLTPVIIVESVDQEAILTFVEKVRPPYLGVGNEINRQDQTSIEAFAEDFNSIYDQIKDLSPNTKVFPVFQLEIMKWGHLELFSKVDLIAFTTYPSLIYETPSEIPDDYYFAIANYTEKPVAFTEVGWPGVNESEQLDFIKIFKEKMEELEPEFVVWTFMYDQNVQKPFDTMGLITPEGTEKEGWKAWTED